MTNLIILISFIFILPNTVVISSFLECSCKLPTKVNHKPIPSGPSCDCIKPIPYEIVIPEQTNNSSSVGKIYKYELQVPKEPEKPICELNNSKIIEVIKPMPVIKPCSKLTAKINKFDFMAPEYPTKKIDFNILVPTLANNILAQKSNLVKAIIDLIVLTKPDCVENIPCRTSSCTGGC